MHLKGKAAGLAAAMPFSFAYGGKSSAELLPTWKRFGAKRPSKPGYKAHASTWADPATGLEVTAEVTLFERYAAVEPFCGSTTRARPTRRRGLADAPGEAAPRREHPLATQGSG